MCWIQVITAQGRQLFSFQKFGKPVAVTLKLDVMGIFTPEEPTEAKIRAPYFPPEEPAVRQLPAKHRMDVNTQKVLLKHVLSFEV